MSLRWVPSRSSLTGRLSSDGAQLWKQPREAPLHPREARGDRGRLSSPSEKTMHGQFPGPVPESSSSGPPDTAGARASTSCPRALLREWARAPEGPCRVSSYTGPSLRVPCLGKWHQAATQAWNFEPSWSFRDWPAPQGSRLFSSSLRHGGAGRSPGRLPQTLFLTCFPLNPLARPLSE